MDFDIYVMMKTNYLKENNRNVDDDNDDLFPYNWHLIGDYHLKTEILFEAISNKVTITQTDKYRKFMNIHTDD